MRDSFRRPGRSAGLIGVLSGLVFLVSGCAEFLPALGPAGPTPEERAAYEAAAAKLPNDPRGAQAAFEQFTLSHPKSTLTDDAYEQLAEISLSRGRQELGMRWLRRLLADHPRGDRVAPARLRLAELEYGRDRRDTARQLLIPIELDRLSLDRQRSALRLQASLARTPVERLEPLTRLRGLLARLEGQGEAADVRRVSTRRRSVEQEIDSLVRRAATPELESMMRSLRGRPPAGEIALELSKRAVDAGDLDLARRRIARTGEFVRNDAQRARLQELEVRLARLDGQAVVSQSPEFSLGDVGSPAVPQTDQARGTLGVVLPLTGDFADYGEESLRGILLAAGVFEGAQDGSSAYEIGGDGQRAGIRLVVRDTAGDPGTAARVVRELGSDPSILGIIGPIFTQESLAAADAAEEMGVPLVALSTREDLPERRSYAFRTRTMPKDEIDVLVDHAFDSLDAKRFAVLYPRTRYGRGMRKLYWDAVRARGGKMVAASSYDPDTVDFADSIQGMIGYRFLTNGERAALRERETVLRNARRLDHEEAREVRAKAYAKLGPEGDPLPPIVDFDVLFIPDAADKIALIAPGLAFHEIRGVRLLGSSDWIDESLPKVGRRHVSRAVVSAPFYAESELPWVAEFVNGFRQTFSAEPGMYAAEAYDAAKLLLVPLAEGRDDRGSVRDGLLETRGHAGATGILSMHPTGNARRKPQLLEISGGRFRALD